MEKKNALDRFNRHRMEQSGEHDWANGDLAIKIQHPIPTSQTERGKLTQTGTTETSGIHAEAHQAFKKRMEGAIQGDAGDGSEEEDIDVDAHIAAATSSKSLHTTEASISGGSAVSAPPTLSSGRDTYRAKKTDGSDKAHTTPKTTDRLPPHVSPAKGPGSDLQVSNRRVFQKAEQKMDNPQFLIAKRALRALTTDFASRIGGSRAFKLF